MLFDEKNSTKHADVNTQSGTCQTGWQRCSGLEKVSPIIVIQYTAALFNFNRSMAYISQLQCKRRRRFQKSMALETSH